MNTRGNSLDEIAERLVDAILSDNFLQRDKLIPRCRSIIQAWVKVNDRPVNYDEPKTSSGKLQKTIEQRGFEKEYWRSKIIEIKGKENMQKYYDELDKSLIDMGYIKS
jgi:hypothetical protein